jgi:hypothetical protein
VDRGKGDEGEGRGRGGGEGGRQGGGGSSGFNYRICGPTWLGIVIDPQLSLSTGDQHYIP